MTIKLGYLRFHLFFDIWGAKATFFDNLMRYDIVNYTDFCIAGQWAINFVKMQLFTQIDVDECLIGLIGALTTDTADCKWSTYFIDFPFVDLSFVDESYGGPLYNYECPEDIFQ